MSPYPWARGSNPPRLRGEGEYGLRQAKTVNGVASQQTWDTAAGLPPAPGRRYPLPLWTGWPPAGAGRRRGDCPLLRPGRAGLDGAGATAATYSYDPYGRLTGSTGTAATPFGYAGQYADAETGLQYLRARYYDPATSQFLTRDPLLALTGQPYAYTADNPLNASDPSGLRGCSSYTAQGVIGRFECGAMRLLQHGCTAEQRSAYASGDTMCGVTGWLRQSIAASNQAQQAADAAQPSGAPGPVQQAVQAVGRAAQAPDNPRQEAARDAAVRPYVDAASIVFAAFYPIGGLDAAAGRIVGSELDRMGGMALTHEGQSVADTALSDAERTTTQSVAECCVRCFPSGTRIATPRGEVAIETLHMGERMLAENPTTGKVEAEPVQRVIHDPASPLMAVSVSDGSAITVTADHPFWLDSGARLNGPGRLPAGHLRVGDHLRTASGHDMIVTGLRHNVGRALVYTLTVAHDHTYFVGTARVLVHNCEEPVDSQAALSELVARKKPTNYKYRSTTYLYTSDNLTEATRASLLANDPNGVPFTDLGFPTFSDYVYVAEDGQRAEVQIAMTGDQNTDFSQADAAMGWTLRTRPRNWTWHHMEDRTTMQLVPTFLHGQVGHSGGAWVIKRLGVLP